MSDSIFCPNCGMLKSNCVCGKSKKVDSSGPTNLFSFKKPVTHSILDDEIYKLNFNVNLKLWLDSLFCKLIGG